MPTALMGTLSLQACTGIWLPLTFTRLPLLMPAGSPEVRSAGSWRVEAGPLLVEAGLLLVLADPAVVEAEPAVVELLGVVLVVVTVVVFASAGSWVQLVSLPAIWLPVLSRPSAAAIEDRVS